MITEEMSRPIPWQAWEFAWARQRPAQHRPPLPAVGDTVLYRHDAWGDVTEATVAKVQDLDDITDPNLWGVQLDPAGQPVTFQGRQLIAQAPDPWPDLYLHTQFGYFKTREARLRGSPGWLPHDWQLRYRPIPGLLTPTS